MAYLPDEAIDRLRELSKGARHLYVFLARCRNQKTGLCCPSVSTTQEALDANRATVYALRKELTSKGWAQFSGDRATYLLGFNSPKNQTPFVESIEDSADSPIIQTVTGQSPIIQTNSPIIQTQESNYSDKQSNYSDSHIRNNQQIEPRERETRARADSFQTPFEDLAPQLSPVEDALRLAKRWPEILSPKQFAEIKQAAQALSRYNGSATPERIAKIGDYYRAQNRPSWGLSWAANDWPTIADWCAANEPKQSRQSQPEQKWEELPEDFKARFRNL